MSSINVSNDTKMEFTEMQPEDMTQDEFFQELLAAKRRDDGEVVDAEAIAEAIKTETASAIEIAAYRGTAAALEDVQ